MFCDGVQILYFYVSIFYLYICKLLDENLGTV